MKITITCGYMEWITYSGMEATNFLRFLDQMGFEYSWKSEIARPQFRGIIACW
jgi:hypothetical protein